MTANASGGRGVRGSTSEVLVAAAAAEFSTHSYEGVSLRNIERRAGVTRGLAAHHFGSKEALWEASVDWLVREFRSEIDRYREFLELVSPSERGPVVLKVYARFASKHPEFFRLVLFEGSTKSPRSRRMAEEFLEPLSRFVDEGREHVGTPEQSAIRKFVLFGAASTIFAVPAQCEYLFGFDPSQEGFVELFVETLAKIYSAFADDDTPELAAQSAEAPRREADSASSAS